MTITELLKRMLGAYPSFDSKAGETWTPVFRARLADREGPILAQAYVEVLATFKPTTRQPFPIPLDFERHMPDRTLKLAEDTPSLREPAKRHDELMVKLMDEWWASQGMRIQEARGHLVAISCKHLAGDLAKRFAWRDDPPKVRLTTDQIDIAVSRTVSRQRVIMFGPIPKKAEIWRDQMEMAKAALTPAPRMEAAE